MPNKILIKLDDGSQFYKSEIDHLGANKSTGKYRVVLQTGKVFEIDKDTFQYLLTTHNLSAVVQNIT